MRTTTRPKSTIDAMLTTTMSSVFSISCAISITGAITAAASNSERRTGLSRVSRSGAACASSRIDGWSAAAPHSR